MIASFPGEGMPHSFLRGIGTGDFPQIFVDGAKVMPHPRGGLDMEGVDKGGWGGGGVVFQKRFKE
jgi:hypothetical protein